MSVTSTSEEIAVNTSQPLPKPQPLRGQAPAQPRNYVAYIPVPISDEEEEEDEYYEDEDEDEEYYEDDEDYYYEDEDEDTKRPPKKRPSRKRPNRRRYQPSGKEINVFSSLLERRSEKSLERSRSAAPKI